MRMSDSREELRIPLELFRSVFTNGFEHRQLLSTVGLHAADEALVHERRESIDNVDFAERFDPADNILDGLNLRWGEDRQCAKKCSLLFIEQLVAPGDRVA
jgi:hypothetical protein